MDSPSVRLANNNFLISQALVAIGEVDNATIGEAVLLDVVLHDMVVLVSVDTDVCITREAEVHDVAEDAVNVRITGNAMDDMIGSYVVLPFTIVYLRVGRFRGGQESKIAHDMTIIFYDKATMLFRIAEDDCF